jgi:GNAT superfamily N-acetyltransferase
MRIDALERAQLAEAELVLADACAFDRATEVAEEKLFGIAPAVAALGAAVGGATSPTTPATQAARSVPRAFGAWDGDTLVGVAAVASKWLRVIAVVPRSRRRGAGSALLAACEEAARTAGETRMRVLDQPGNYLAPGVDERNTDAIAWLERRTFERAGEPRCNVLIAVRDNPRVSSERAAQLAAAAATRGYTVRRAQAGERALLDAVAADFGGAWPFELERALEYSPPGVHVAIKDGAYCAFAAHDGNNRGLGWFGPTGTWPSHRGQGLGEALLVACLVDVATEHARCEVAWIGPRPFYDKVAGIVDERRFVALAKNL